MDLVGWQPCRLAPFNGSSSAETVGPRPARCTYAGWSPDGRTMYFSADAGDGYHIWRQRFPRGVPEQLTSGATEEEGIAVAPDGNSLVTSAGIRESTVWIHDARGDRQISGEGFANVPGLGFVGTGTHSVFSADGKKLFYLIRKQGSRAYRSGELRVTDLDSGRTEAVLPGVSVSEFDISPDGQRVAFAALDAEGNSHVWVAPLDRRTPPKQLTSSVARQPDFGPGGDVYFLMHEGGQEFLSSVGPNETVPRRIDPEPSAEYEHISPHGGWRLSGDSPGGAIAYPTLGGTPILICSSCEAGWGPGVGFFI
jgi:eukaryotic-like serine/threonine-protein kinase